MIAIDGVSASYGGTLVLDGATLHVEAGRCLALVGPSGSGKSTLLRVVLGLIVPERGTVRVNGELVTPESARRVRLRSGYVIQDGGLFPHLTAYDNIALVPRRLGWARERIEARVRELYALTGIEPELAGRFPSELSGGQRQRVGLMRALVLDPDMLVMDEPMGALDPVLRTRMQRDLKALFVAVKKTVLIVTHDLGEAAFLADEIAVLARGSVVQQGTYEELAAKPRDAFVAELLASRGASRADPGG